MKHPPGRVEKLRRGGFTQQADLLEHQIQALDALPAHASRRQIEEAVHSKPPRPKAPTPEPEPKPNPKAKAKKKAGPPTVGGEAVRILQERGPMHYRDLADLLVEEGKVKVGKTFKQTLSAELTRRQDAERVAPGVYKAKEE